MKLITLAEEYLALCAYSKDTESKIRTSAKLFDERAGVEIEHLTAADIGQFKSATLSLAKPITYNVICATLDCWVAMRPSQAISLKIFFALQSRGLLVLVHTSA